MDYDDARKACRGVKGKLSDITSRQHYNVMMAYIRRIIPESEQKLDAWTAMTLMITVNVPCYCLWSRATPRIFQIQRIGYCIPSGAFGRAGIKCCETTRRLTGRWPKGLMQFITLIGAIFSLSILDDRLKYSVSVCLTEMEVRSHWQGFKYGHIALGVSKFYCPRKPLDLAKIF